MASKKITITVPEQQFRRVRALVEQGAVPTVSSFVQRAISTALDDLAGWSQSLDQQLDASGGAPTALEAEWLEQVFNKPAA